MGCCFSSESEPSERDPLIPQPGPGQTSIIRNNDNRTSTPPPLPVPNNDNSEDESQTQQFMNVDATIINENIKDVSERKSNIYAEQLNRLNPKFYPTPQLPNVIDPNSVLLMPGIPKQEMEQIETSAKLIASLVEQMKPKVKEPITTVSLDW